MSKLRRLLLLRHGESSGGSGTRLIGRGDPELSSLGREQMRAAGRELAGEVIDQVVASPLRRSWQSATALVPGTPIRLEPDFREIDFGRWEGLTPEEIRERDPVAYEEWQSGGEGFAFPGGESRADFRTRVRRGLERLLAAPGRSALLVVHKGVIRVLVEELTGEKLEAEQPKLGELVRLTRQPDDRWLRGKRSSNPPSLEAA